MICSYVELDSIGNLASSPAETEITCQNQLSLGRAFEPCFSPIALYVDFLNWYIQTKNFCYVVLDIGDEDAAVGSHGQIQESTMSLTNYNKISQFAGVTECEEVSCSNHGSLVQATISTLFKKAEEKKAPRKPRKSPPPKVSSQKLQHTTSKRKIDQLLLQVDGRRKKGKVIEERSAGSGFTVNTKQYEVEDDIEDFSSTSQGTDGSDKDWAA
ncbi:hypothetical protein L1049_005519 [Liquidambar formosana]|uniref:Uncharacterized protein n=1 Tax=Liquidambar formosana TaxID=63359 RepID=A0AAP0N5F0_LIQFO